MTEQQVYEGKDLEEAIALAATELGIEENDLHYEIVEQGRRGVFGLGAKSVQIRVMPSLDKELPAGEDHGDRPSRPKRRRRGAKPAKSAEPDEPAERATIVLDAETQPVIDTLDRMLDLIGLRVSTEVDSLDNGLTITLKGQDRKLLLERNAELLGSLQFLINRMARRSWPEVRRINLQCDGKGGRGRDDDLVSLVREVAQQVTRTGKTKRLQPMNSYERRLVHLTVRDYGGLSSSSDGNGALKRVRISKVRNSME